MCNTSLNAGDTVFLLRALSLLGIQCQLAEHLLTNFGVKTVLVTNGPNDLDTFRRFGHDPSIFADCIYFDDAEMRALLEPVPDEGRLQDEVRRVETSYRIRLLDAIRTDRQYGMGYITGVQTMRTPFMKRAKYNEVLAVATRMADFWAAAIGKHRPAVVIAYPGSLSSYLLVEIALKQGIPMRAVTAPRRLNYFYWAANRFCEPINFETQFELVVRKLADQPSAMTIANGDTSDEQVRPLASTINFSTRRSRATYQALVRGIVSYCIANFSFYWFKNSRQPMLYLFRDRLAAFVFSWIDLRRDLRASPLLNKIDSATPYVFFPLCFEPELSLLADAIDAPSQLTIIDWLARSAPAGWRVIVKEHPAMTLRRPPLFWKTVQKFPNVLVASKYESGEDLMRGATAVAVINGTLGIQAAEHLKPILCFHHSYIGRVLPQVRITESLRSVKEALADIAAGIFQPTRQWRDANTAWLEVWKQHEFQVAESEFYFGRPVRKRIPDAEMRAMAQRLVESLQPMPTIVPD